LSRGGADEALYKGQPDEKREFRVRQHRQPLFGLAYSLQQFPPALRPAPRQVHGAETFTYGRVRKNSTSFNYTENEDAKELQRWFEAIARGRYLYAQLEARLRYDRLGIIPVIRELERDFNAGQIIDPQQFAPLLQQVANDPQIAKLAQTRAGEMLRRIQGAPPRLQLELVEKPTGRYYRLVVDGPTITRSTRRGSWRSRRTQPWMPPSVARLQDLLQLTNNLRGMHARPTPMSSRLSIASPTSRARAHGNVRATAQRAGGGDGACVPSGHSGSYLAAAG
jgi:hypothetical protein